MVFIAETNRARNETSIYMVKFFIRWLIVVNVII